jgi:hypothetical protein
MHQPKLAKTIGKRGSATQKGATQCIGGTTIALPVLFFAVLGMSLVKSGNNSTMSRQCCKNWK